MPSLFDAGPPPPPPPPLATQLLHHQHHHHQQQQLQKTNGINGGYGANASMYSSASSSVSSSASNSLTSSATTSNANANTNNSNYLTTTNLTTPSKDELIIKSEAINPTIRGGSVSSACSIFEQKHRAAQQKQETPQIMSTSLYKKNNNNSSNYSVQPPPPSSLSAATTAANYYLKQSLLSRHNQNQNGNINNYQDPLLMPSSRGHHHHQQHQSTSSDYVRFGNTATGNHHRQPMHQQQQQQSQQQPTSASVSNYMDLIKENKNYINNNNNKNSRKLFSTSNNYFQPVPSALISSSNSNSATASSSSPSSQQTPRSTKPFSNIMNSNNSNNSSPFNTDDLDYHHHRHQQQQQQNQMQRNSQLRRSSNNQTTNNSNNNNSNSSSNNRKSLTFLMTNNGGGGGNSSGNNEGSKSARNYSATSAASASSNRRFHPHENGGDDYDDDLDNLDVNLDCADEDDNIFIEPAETQMTPTTTTAAKINNYSHPHQQHLRRDQQQLMSSAATAQTDSSNSLASVNISINIPNNKNNLNNENEQQPTFIKTVKFKNTPPSQQQQQQQLKSTSALIGKNSTNSPKSPASAGGSSSKTNRLSSIMKNLPINPFIMANNHNNNTSSSASASSASSTASSSKNNNHRNHHHNNKYYTVNKEPTVAITDLAAMAAGSLLDLNNPGRSTTAATANYYHLKAANNYTPMSMQLYSETSANNNLQSASQASLSAVNNMSNYAIPTQFANFFHFDVQSSFFNYAEIKAKKYELFNSCNVRSGASAASTRQTSASITENLMHHQKSPPSQVADGVMNMNDSGGSSSLSSTTSESIVHLQQQQLSSSASPTSNKNLVDECSCFQIELGGDVFKGLGLIESTSQRRLMRLNSLSVLNKDGLYYAPDLSEQIDVNDNEPFTIEYLDWGSYFYRYYFYDHDHFNYLGMDADLGPVVISIRREKILMDSAIVFNISNDHHHPQQQSSASTNSKRILFNNLNALAARTGSAAAGDANSEKSSEYVYRMIVRTSDLSTLRGTMPEEHLMNVKSSNSNATTNSNSKSSSSNSSSSSNLTHKDIIGYLLPDLDLSCLKLGDSQKLCDRLMDFDELDMLRPYKIGVLLCKAGQSSEEEMYNNEHSTPEFDDFLKIIGDKIPLNGFQYFRAGLDVSDNVSTGTHSIYTRYQKREIMFHVSTMLPYSTSDRQQLTRKRHIGNDMVTIIFQEYGSMPFSPKWMRSHFQHIFIIVRAMNPSSQSIYQQQQYSVAVSFSKDIPYFGPPLPKNPLFIKSKEFRNFLLAKIINADNAGLKCNKFSQMKMRARHGSLAEMYEKYATKLTLENCASSNGSNGGSGGGGVSSKFGLFNFGSLKQRKLRSKSLQMFNNSSSSSSNNNNNESSSLDPFGNLSLFAFGDALFWTIESVEDSIHMFKNCCYLGLSKQNLVAVNALKKCVLFSISCSSVIGWTFRESINNNSNNNSNLSNLLIVYFDQGEYVQVQLRSKSDLYQVVKRLECFTKGCKTIELNLDKRDCGQLGFKIHNDGVVTEVEPNSIAYCHGLRQGTRIVRICDHFVINLSHQKMLDLFRNSSCLKVSFLMPFDDGNARRGQQNDEMTLSLYAYLSTCSALCNERPIDSIETTATTVMPHGRKLLNRSVNNENSCSDNYMDCGSGELGSGSGVEKQRRRSAFSNHLYYGQQQQQQSSSSTNLNKTSSNSQSAHNLKFASEAEERNNLNDHHQPMHYSMLINNHLSPPPSLQPSVRNNHLEWTRMFVQKASKSFENAHRKSSENFYSDNYISTNDIIEESSAAANRGAGAAATTNFIRTNDLDSPSAKQTTLAAATTTTTTPTTVYGGVPGGGFDYDKMASPVQNRERKISFDELRDQYVRLQLELNKEKQQKLMVASKFESIAEENSILKRELDKLKDENKHLSTKVIVNKNTTNGNANNPTNNKSASFFYAPANFNIDSNSSNINAMMMMQTQTMNNKSTPTVLKLNGNNNHHNNYHGEESMDMDGGCSNGQANISCYGNDSQI